MRRLFAAILALLLICPAAAHADSTRIDMSMLGDELSDEGMTKVRAIVAECVNAVGRDEYEIAVWLHDWLTHNGCYDTGLSPDRHDAEDLLLDGIGVCEAYATAYSALLDEAGIENLYVASDSMGHVWNMVKINDVWCHVDVTWDDPTTGSGTEPTVSGCETHTYFGLTDDMMSGMGHYGWYGLFDELPQATCADYAYAVRTEKAKK